MVVPREKSLPSMNQPSGELGVFRERLAGSDAKNSYVLNSLSPM
jgi:hypothetical protein